MIVPTPEFDPLFARDGIPFQQKMLDYIDREFSDLLGPHRAWLREPQGLDKLASCYSQRSDSGDAASRRAA